MPIIIDNLYWMGINIILAFLGIAFGWMFFYTRRPLFSFIFFILWVLFIPNTIYLITDLEYFPKQWLSMDLLGKLILFIQYGILASLGVITFIIAMYPVDKVFTKLHLKKRKSLKFIILLLVNFFIAFGLILGKFQRTHSWYIFTDYKRVVEDTITVFQTPILLILVFFFGIVLNLTYFGFKNVIHFKKFN